MDLYGFMAIYELSMMESSDKLMNRTSATSYNYVQFSWGLQTNLKLGRGWAHCRKLWPFIGYNW